MWEILLVQLFSSPQQQVASSTNREPRENRRLPAPSKERRRLDRVMRPMAIQSLPDTFSLNSSSAIRVVVTISKLPSREALEAVPRLIPIIRKTGAPISRRIIPMT